MPETKHRLTPRAFLDLKTAHSPHISPDTTRVVFVVNEVDFEESRWISHLWLADVVEGRARQITFSFEGEHAPRWSPDGRYIAFLSARPDMTEPPPEEEEDQPKEQIWYLPVDGGEAQRWTNMKEGVRSFDWLPDSTAIVYLAPEARPQPIQFVRDNAYKRKVDPQVEHEEKLRMQFWEIGVEEKKPELLYTGDFGIAEFDISPDGKSILFNTNHTGEANDYYRYDLFVLDVEEGTARKVVERDGGQFQPQWSPDGSRITFLANLDPALSFSQECVWEFALDNEPTNLFADAPYDAHHVLWARADASLYAIVADRMNGPLLRLTREGATPITDPNATGECSDFDVGANNVVVAVLEDERTPPELYVIEPDGSRRALTELNKEFVEKYEMPTQEIVRWQSEDGLEIEGLLISPPQAASEDALPLIVQVHGGPKGRAGNSLRSYYMHAVWAAEGYRVLLPNFRGSEGYGNAFAIANRRDLGGGDFRDIMTGVDLVIERGLVDPQRLGIMGGSYGGYMTNWAIGQTDRFAAAISMFGIFNLVTDYSNSEIPRWDPDYMGALYWEDPEIYKKCSPATYLENIRTPVLILHGDCDSNTFISNSKEMYQALRARGVPCQFVHYPREGHGLREPNHKLDEMRRCLAWFDRYLRGTGEAPPAYRISDRIEHDGYELYILHAEDGEYAGWHEDWGRLLETAFSIASREAVEEAWRFDLDDVRLIGPDSADCPLQGVPIDAGGGRMLIEGTDLALNIHPDKDTGRVGFSLAPVFRIPPEGGPFTLRIGDFPPVAFTVGPKEEKAPEESGETSDGEHAFSTPGPEEESPSPTPQKNS